MLIALLLTTTSCTVPREFPPLDARRQPDGLKTDAHLNLEKYRGGTYMSVLRELGPTRAGLCVMVSPWGADQ